MRIAIIGAGNIGSTLGKKWLARGHQVSFGVRDLSSDKTQARIKDIPQATFQLTKEAIKEAEVVVLAVPGKVVESVIDTLGQDLNDKLILDATNLIGQDTMHSFEHIHQVAPRAKLYRAFNSLGWENFDNPIIHGQTIDHFYCGDPDAHSSIDNLIKDIGLNPIYLGGLEHTATLDALTKLWFNLAFQKGYGRRVALKVLSE
jgi:hypothetical protein